MHLHVVSLVAILISLSLTMTAQANHADCYWKGPGTGTPEQQHFTPYCTASAGPAHIPETQRGTQATAWICGSEAYGGPYVADWNVLGEHVLEFASPCNGPGGGYSDDCSFGLFAVCLHNFTDPFTNEKEPCRFLRKWDDCQWEHALKEDELPDLISVWRR